MQTLFVIDDDLIAQFIISKFLKQTALCNKASYYQDAETVFKYLIDNRENPDRLPDVIVLETQLPLLSGWDFLNELKAFYSTLAKKVLIYIVTTIVSTDTKMRASLYPFIAGVYQKPVTKGFLFDVKKGFDTAQVESN